MSQYVTTFLGMLRIRDDIRARVEALVALKHITVSGFSLVLGFAALLGAISRIWRTDLPVLAVCLLIIGASLVAKPLLTKTT